MSLRLRLFLGLSGLVAALVLAQWWWVQGLTRELSTEVDTIAVSVSKSVVAHLTLKECPEGEVCPDGDEPAVDFVLPEGARGETFVQFLASAAPTRGDAGAESGGVEEEHGVFYYKTTSREELEVTVSDEGPKRGARAFVVAPGAETAETGAATWISESHTVLLDDDSGEAADSERLVWTGDGIAWRTVEPHRFKVVVAPEGSEPKNVFFGEPGLARRYLSLGGPGGRIPIPSEGFNEKLEVFRHQLLLGSAGILGLGLLLAGVVAHRVSAPLRRLAKAAREIGDGAFGTQVAVAGSGEVGQAIHAFNRMSTELETLDKKARELRARRHLGEIGEIARGLAHTLRNPLNALGLSVEELAAEARDAPRSPQGDGGEAGGLAESARRQIRRIDHSIRSFLVLASQGGGAVDDVDVGGLVQDVALEALQDARGRVRLDVDTAAAAPLRGVEPELRAVVQALVVNAVEASPEGGTVTVHVRAAGEGRVRVEVEDRGPGLPEEVRERLFTPHLTTKANGSGMGLFLAHRIATTRYDGSLELADRAEDGGTRAVLELGPRSEELDDA